MKFEFAPDEEWAPPPEPDPGQSQDKAQARGGEPPPPGALIAAATERLHSRTRADFSRLHTCLNRLRYTVETTRPQAEPTFTGSVPELGAEVFRPQAFRAHPLEDTHG